MSSTFDSEKNGQGQLLGPLIFMSDCDNVLKKLEVRSSNLMNHNLSGQETEHAVDTVNTSRARVMAEESEDSPK